MRRPILSLAIIALIVVSGPLLAQVGPRQINEVLSSFEEVPALSTPGVGRFSARIAANGSAIVWELRYTNLESDVAQAHIHLENATNNGPITVFLCTNLGNGPAGIQACPPAPVTIRGTIRAADVSPDIAATAAAISAGLGTGELGELIKAMRAGATYVNVHSTTRGGGEIRAQLSVGPDQGQGQGNPN